jgi:hypothetical protein
MVGEKSDIPRLTAPLYHEAAAFNKAETGFVKYGELRNSRAEGLKRATI